MKPETYFRAYIGVRNKLQYYRAQQGGDYSRRIARTHRQAVALERKIYSMLGNLTTVAVDSPTAREKVQLARDVVDKAWENTRLGPGWEERLDENLVCGILGFAANTASN